LNEISNNWAEENKEGHGKKEEEEYEETKEIEEAGNRSTKFREIFCSTKQGRERKQGGEDFDVNFISLK
jgi:hypothetical protein